MSSLDSIWQYSLSFTQVLPDFAVKDVEEVAKTRRVMSSLRDIISNIEKLKRIIALCIETGLITASIAAVDIVFYICFPHNNLHIVP